jgi:hypothetical protein
MQCMRGAKAANNECMSKGVVGAKQACRTGSSTAAARCTEHRLLLWLACSTSAGCLPLGTSLLYKGRDKQCRGASSSRFMLVTSAA